MTPAERAVIAAARRLRESDPYNLFASEADTSAVALAEALDALDASMNGTEIAWHEIAEGDQLRSAKSGTFWEVISVQRMRDGYKVGIRLGDKRALITRPTETEPTAWVKRGATGAAVDQFVNVFSSDGFGRTAATRGRSENGQ